jgi:hypothetical protein
MKSQRIRIMVMGGRFAPHFLGVVVAPPDIVEIVASKNTDPKQVEYAEKALNSINLKVTEDNKNIVDAYNFQDAFTVFKNLINKYPNSHLTFDIISAPKIPSFAARDVAKEFNQQLIFVDSRNGQIIKVEPQEESNKFRIQIGLEEYLRCFGREPEYTFNISQLSINSDIAQKVSEFLVDNHESSNEALELIRSTGQGRNKRTIPFKKSKSVTSNALSILKKLNDFGLIYNIESDENNKVKYTIENDCDFKFLEGLWLEFYIYSRAKEMIDEENQEFWDDIAMSVRIHTERSNKEIDIACMYRGQLIMCSCKSGKNVFETKHLDELRSVSDLVGGDFTTRLFITNQLPPAANNHSSYNDYQKFLDQAKARKIVVVTGESLKNIENILRLEAIQPTYQRI